MHDNHRDNFNHRQEGDPRNDDPAARWRRGEDRYRREAYGSGGGSGGQGRSRLDDDSNWDRGRNQDYGYAGAFRDDDYGRRGSYGSQGGSRGYAQRDFAGGRDSGQRQQHDDQGGHWHEHEHDQRAGHPYSGTYGGTGDSSYFTGTQGSWAVAPTDRRPMRGGYAGGQSFGSDYRSHGYSGRDDDPRGFLDRAVDRVASWFGDEDAGERREEGHRGRGPKDYTRSDERIREDANDRLTDDWRVDASHVTVTVQNGEITLNGTVSSREEKRRAEDVVDSISGVKHVQNNLRVQQTTGGTTSGGTSGGGFTNNWATNSSSTAEGGVASQPSASEQAKQTSQTGKS